jgi:hypothetical protein
MDYKVGQPVKWAGWKGQDAYRQEFGPKAGKCVKRGIVTEVHSNGHLDVWWENCDHPLYTYKNEVRACNGWFDKSEGGC